MSFIITVDSGCCISDGFISENDIRVIPFSYSVNENIYYDADKVPSVKPASAAVCAPEISDYVDFWRRTLSEGRSVLHISTGSLFGRAFSNALAAREILLAQNSGIELFVVDSASLSCGCALLLQSAVALRDEKISAKQCAFALESEKHKIRGFVISDDCRLLYRYGFVPASALLRTSITGEKAVFPVGFSGGAVFFSRTTSDVLDLVGKAQRLCISHCGAFDKALKLADELRNNYGSENIEICEMSSSQAFTMGEGSVALFFRGNIAQAALPCTPARRSFVLKPTVRPAYL